MAVQSFAPITKDIAKVVKGEAKEKDGWFLDVLIKSPPLRYRSPGGTPYPGGELLSNFHKEYVENKGGKIREKSEISTYRKMRELKNGKIDSTPQGWTIAHDQSNKQDKIEDVYVWPALNSAISQVSGEQPAASNRLLDEDIDMKDYESE